MAVKILSYSMPRGDSRSIPVSVPLDTYSVGAKIFFALKSAIDNQLDDSTAVLKKTLTDANIVSTDATNKNYVMSLSPSDTNLITPDTYLGEFEFVSADQSVVETFPDPHDSTLEWEITGDVNRRTS